jgi:hypothetical protein
MLSYVSGIRSKYRLSSYMYIHDEMYKVIDNWDILLIVLSHYFNSFICNGMVNISEYLKHYNRDHLYSLVESYVGPVQYRLYGDFLFLLIEEDLRCPSLRYFGWVGTPITWRNLKTLALFEHTAVRCNYVVVNGLNHSATDVLQRAGICQLLYAYIVIDITV